MKKLARLALAAALGASFALHAGAADAPKRTLARFESEEELSAWLDKLKKRYEPAQRAKSAFGAADAMAPQSATASPPAPAAPAALAKAEESITNVQTAGVDEGGIVKVHGDHLVVLRRGRLFTVNVQGNELSAVSMADAFGAGIDPRGAWYDEMLVRGDTIVVIGFSYPRGGTEIGLFDIDRAGVLSHRATYHLRSSDYYSSRNYASRLIGDKLVFYTPLYLNLHGDPTASFPALRRWRSGATAAEFKRIAPATRIYRTDDPVEPWGLTLHTVTACDLGRREMACESTGVLGPAGRVFYVSQGSVYVWTTRHVREGRDARAASAVFRMPLDGAAPSALKTSGAPVDQLSFLESEDGHLNVLLRARGRGEAMWAAESTDGAMALMRVPLALFGNGSDEAPAAAYRRLPSPAGHTLQNRFVGAWLLYGSGTTWGAPNAQRGSALHALRWADARSTAQTLSLGHGVDRIEAMGRNALVVGTSGKDLHFSSVRLDEEATIPHRYTRADAAQGETRTHGFFYKPEAGDSGLIGLPVVGGGRPGHKQLRQGSAAVAFLRNDALMLTELGDLAAGAGGNGGADDGCKASCVDWYGNARPIFLRGRVFALLGYEIVEGRIAGGAMSEVRRASFAPQPRVVQR